MAVEVAIMVASKADKLPVSNRGSRRSGGADRKHVQPGRAAGRRWGHRQEVALPAPPLRADSCGSELDQGAGFFMQSRAFQTRPRQSAIPCDQCDELRLHPTLLN